MWMNKNLPSPGFTLIELMIVMAVLAVLATLSFFGLRGAQAAARDVQRMQFMKGVQVALQTYNINRERYPQSSDFTGFCGNDFCAVVLYLSGGGCFNAGDQLNYLSMATLVDPANKLPICGAPPDACGWGNPTCNGAVYSAVANGTDYTLTLTKEGGGTSIFKSPQ